MFPSLPAHFAPIRLQVFLLRANPWNDSTIEFFTIEFTGNKAARCSARSQALKNYLACAGLYSKRRSEQKQSG